MGKKKKHKLTFQFDFNFFLLGISSSENDYRLSWEINKKLKISLRKSTDHVIKREEIEQVFSVYTFSDEEVYLQYFLIANKSENGYLIEELRNMDYFLQIHGDLTDKQQEQFISSVRNIKGITGVFNLDINTMKSKNKLIIE
ncbi:MAG: IPExxxVDY family protein [Bacteroidales bacterium]|nr:IPExxxVDY family protein [Bacteroidales bacterium]